MENPSASLVKVEPVEVVSTADAVNTFDDKPEYILLQNLVNDNTSFQNGYEGNNSDTQPFDDPEYSNPDSEDSSDDEEDEYECKICKQKFIDEFELEQHCKSRRIADRIYKCCKCDKGFRDNTQLNVHSRKHTGEQPYACKVCGKRFSVNGNLSKHMRIHTGERKYECDTCERKFTQFAHLEDHMKVHSEKAEEICYSCYIKPTEWCDDSRVEPRPKHAILEIGDRPFVCDFCNSGFKTKARLRKHQKSHEDDKVTRRSVPCPICCKLMKSTKQLVAHMETHDEGAHNPFPCNLCNKTYKNFFSLNYHLKSHGSVKDFKCNLCDKAFTNASHLRRHMNSHTGIRPYNCEICNRAFPSQQNLKRHLMTHTGEKPYNCDTCTRSFLTLENLNRHKRTHTGEKPFPCNICGRFFAHSTTAKEHMRIHTGDKPFCCSLCNKCFALNKALYKHTREKHPEYFPEFKRINDIPPNQKRAREKIKRETLTDGYDVIQPDRVDVSMATNYVDSKLGILDKDEKFNGQIQMVDIDIKDDKISATALHIAKNESCVSDGIVTKVERTDELDDMNKDIKSVNVLNSEITFVKVEKPDYDSS